MGLTRRDLLHRVFVLGGATGVTLVLQACGSTSSPSAPASTTAPATAAAKFATPAAAAESAAPTPIPALQVVGTVTTGQEKVPGSDIIVMPPKSAQPVTLRFHMRTGGEKSEPGIYVYRPQEWEKATGNKVTLEPIPGDANYVPKLLTLAAAGTIGDLTWASDGHNEYRHLARAKVLEPLDDYLQKASQPKTQWLKPVVDTLSMDGKFWALPKAGYPGYSWIWVNLKMFKEAGLDEPPVYGTTHDQLAEWANKLSKGSKDRRDVYGLALYVEGNYGATNGVRQFGGDLISADGTESLVNQKPFLDWLQWAQKLIAVDKVHPFTQDIPSGGLQGMFAAEKVAMVENDRSFQFQVRNAVKDKFPWKVIGYPHPANSKGYCAIVAGHAITAASKDKDVA
ncbi:MAG TPA: extracellular solute-binding protein, partial [Chloroflexota bacterium]|nr:extracellular solute-binding protein [Chloroflexota bacterium]